MKPPPPPPHTHTGDERRTATTTGNITSRSLTLTHTSKHICTKRGKRDEKEKANQHQTQGSRGFLSLSCKRDHQSFPRKHCFFPLSLSHNPLFASRFAGRKERERESLRTREREAVIPASQTLSASSKASFLSLSSSGSSQDISLSLSVCRETQEQKWEKNGRRQIHGRLLRRLPVPLSERERERGRLRCRGDML